MRILIVGAGVGGLTLAALLRQRGLAPDIIDSAPSLAAKGHPLALHTLGSRVLHGLGMHRTFMNLSAPLGDDMRILDRAELVSLLSRAGHQPEIRLGVSVTSLNSEDGRVGFSSGQDRAYDLVVAADGARSQVRELIGSAVDRTRSRWMCLTWWSDRGRQERGAFEHAAGGRFVGLYASPNRIAVVAAAPSRVLEGDGDKRKARMTRAFRKADAFSRAALESLPPDVFWSPLTDSIAGNWRKGRIVLLGDAACSFVPLAKIGAAMAMESAAVLADELSRSGRDGVPAALASFEKRRRHRIETVLDDSRKLGRNLTAGPNPVSWFRRRAYGSMTGEDFARRMAAMLAGPI